ncbi:hypothetical protein B0I37DRAFT_352630 [Chaetomium sp. MPI-CAGE-AT-0009]|nr:hypothetical protein B0I37DRAFT_352630 [Chaetomium sp. MPI-CAGE-AT-0009]
MWLPPAQQAGALRALIAVALPLNRPSDRIYYHDPRRNPPNRFVTDTPRLETRHSSAKTAPKPITPELTFANFSQNARLQLLLLLQLLWLLQRLRLLLLRPLSWSLDVPGFQRCNWMDRGE